MNKKKISICIPTYNRAYYLDRLLKNISLQKTSLIEVVIVDDGSTDNTENTVHQYTDILDIIYFYQKNKGRAVALKKAIELVTGDYTLIMDDEDYFKPNAFEVILQDLLKIQKTQKQKAIIGLVYLTEDVYGNLIGNLFPINYLITNLVSINADFNSKGDKKQIVKSSFLKNVVYNTFTNERRIPTYLLWSRLSQYNLFFINHVIAVKEYLNEGMSKNINKIRMDSPMGSRIIYKELFELDKTVYKSFFYRLKNSINFHRYNFHSKNKIKLNNFLLFNTIGYVIGYFFYLKDIFIYKS